MVSFEAETILELSETILFLELCNAPWVICKRKGEYANPGGFAKYPGDISNYRRIGVDFPLSGRDENSNKNTLALTFLERISQ